MFKFGKKSLDQLKTCHKDLQLIMNELIKYYDFSVIEGLRTTERQKKLFKEGKSKLDGANKLSNHQSKDGISRAVDILPYVKGTNAWDDTEDARKRFYFMAGMVFAIANRLLEEGKITHRVRWGGDWDMDMIYKTNSEFVDLPHWEILK